MKIARNVAVFEWCDEWYHVVHFPIQPGARKPWGCGRFSSPLRRAGATQRAARKLRRCGRFSSPLRNSVIFYRLRASGDTPSVTPVGRDSSLREGAGDGLCHSTGRSETPTLRAIFIAPTKGGFHSTGRSETPTLRAIFIAPTEGRVPFNRAVGDSDVAGDFHRPYGGAGAIQPGGRKLQRCGRFSSPLRRGGCHSLGKSGVGASAPTPLGVSGRDEITLVYLAQASIWLWISAMMSSRPESRMVASMVATVCSGSWVPVIRMGRYSL